MAACFKHLVPGGCLLVCRNDHSARGRLADLVAKAAEDASVPLYEVREAPPSEDFPRLEGFAEGDAFEAVIATRNRNERPAASKARRGSPGRQDKERIEKRLEGRKKPRPRKRGR